MREDASQITDEGVGLRGAQSRGQAQTQPPHNRPFCWVCMTQEHMHFLKGYLDTGTQTVQTLCPLATIQVSNLIPILSFSPMKSVLSPSF